MIEPKYALTEHERRFVVRPDQCPELDPATVVTIDDLYIDDCRLRLRQNTLADGRTILKLAKKYAGATPMSRPMTNLYLDDGEYAVLGTLPGRRVHKRRFRVGSFVVDRFDGDLDGLILAEIEAELDTVRAATLPVWATFEVTADPHYDGGSLCRWSADDLAAHRRRYG
jgi:CYTH domain-containing protein